MFGDRLDLPLKNEIHSLCWDGDELVDWAGGGIRYGLDGSVSQRRFGFSYRFDAAQVAPSGRFAVTYERLGTKGVIWREGTFLREINRSYYHANVYDYPVALFALPDGREAIAHCPEEYNRLEIELLETGERLTTRPSGDPADFFHSRLSIDPGGERLMSAGWIWHPFDTISLYSIAEALAEPTALDRLSDPPASSVEITTAAFAPENRLILTSQAENIDFRDDEERTGFQASTIGVYDLGRDAWASVADLEEEAGALMSVGPDYVVGFYDCPKLIHLGTGRVLHRWSDLKTGQQLSSISHYIDAPPPLALDPEHRRFAVRGESGITVITLSSRLPLASSAPAS